MKKLVSLILALILVVSLAACGAPEETNPAMEFTPVSDGAVLGEGAVTFPLTITDKEGNSIHVTIHTDKETVGEALAELSLIDGEMSDYGMYVMTVNGEYHRYEDDGYFWAFYINGESAATGVDGAPVIDGAVYTLAAELVS